MGIKLKGLQLGYMGMDYELMVFPHPNHALMAGGRREGQKTWYQCPALSYLIEHPDGLILWETGISPNWKAEWLAGWHMGKITLGHAMRAGLIQIEGRRTLVREFASWGGHSPFADVKPARPRDTTRSAA